MGLAFGDDVMDIAQALEEGGEGEVAEGYRSRHVGLGFGGRN